MRKVLVMLAQGCEEIEAVTAIDILRRAGIEVTSAGLDDLPVLASRGVMLLPDTTLDLAQHQDFDMIVLPGGQPGTDNLKADKRLAALLLQMAQQGKYLAAICAAPSCSPPPDCWTGARPPAIRPAWMATPRSICKPPPSWKTARSSPRAARHGNGFRADPSGAAGWQGQAAGSRSGSSTLILKS